MLGKVISVVKCLYFLHIDWDWIFQRPQIIALSLDECFDCDFVVVDRLFKPNPSKSNNLKPKHLSRVKIFPKSCTYIALSRINRLLLNKAIPNIKQYDIIWIPYPEFYRYIPSSYNGFIVYDCMDDYLEMTTSKANYNGLMTCETDLLKRADIVFVSSKYLMEKILEKAPTSNIFLVRNGVMADEILPVKNPVCKDSYKIGYFGTISFWMDFKSLEIAASKLSNITFEIVGPNEANYLGNDAVKTKPPIPHDELSSFALNCDCLIMPFIVTDLVKAVDPVKLYEYIAFGNCIVSVYYPELDHFSDFVYFYQTPDELVVLLQALSSDGFPPKYTGNQQSAFLSNNTWNSRLNTVKQVIKEYSSNYSERE